MKAIKLIEPGKAKVADDVPIPHLRDDYILADTRAWALNPADLHHVKHLAIPGCTIGCDWSGVVREVGRNITRFKVGDEVFGICRGGNSLNVEDGAFAEVITAKEHAVFHKPEDMSFEEAATMAVALVTVGQVFYHTMGLEHWPVADGAQANGRTIMVYGASSATGTIAVQIAKLAGYKVLATSSPANFSMLKSRGADHIYDYRDPNTINTIKSQANDNDTITAILDCIGTDEIAAFCANVLSSTGGKYHTVSLSVPPVFKELRPEPEVVATTALAYTLFGEDVEMRGLFTIPARAEEYEFAGRWQGVVEGLLRRDRIVPHPVQDGGVGLEAVLRAIEGFGGLGPSGRKVVCAVG